ncbi:hypothetical protein O1611_g6384 [Lasiodiplodia mahajangana]|uniref:Uncharacterized protein n=1 Tax=Lasiodiplodia mahajangana TaxID=1108764 RepID=A0ACC2JJ84_9PEZI|nr:hypothetical protein O1611_g6384 [Lasiodiplodia mahajangana]
MPPLVTAESDDIDEDDEAEDSYALIWLVFKKLQVTEYTNIDDVDDYLRNNEMLIGDQSLHKVGRRASKSTSFLHYLLKGGHTRDYDNRILLIKWVMAKFPTLYLEGVAVGKSILHAAPIKYMAIPKTEFLRKFIEIYPTQVVEILKHTTPEQNLQGELLNRIIPIVRTSAPPQFLEFFGECPEESESSQVGRTINIMYGNMLI